MSKKYLSVAFAYVGVIVGAGLASGQDLLQYFLSFGATGLIGIAVLTIYSLVSPHPDMADLDSAARNVTPALPNLWLSTINYFALCVVGGIAMAFLLGGSMLRIGEARRAVILAVCGWHWSSARMLWPCTSMWIEFGTSTPVDRGR